VLLSPLYISTLALLVSWPLHSQSSKVVTNSSSRGWWWWSLWWCCCCCCCCNGWWRWLYMQESVTRNYDSVFCFCLQSQLHVIIFWIDVVVVVVRYKVAHFEPLVFFTHNFINGCNGISKQWRWYQRRDGQSAFAPYSLPCLEEQSGGCGSRNISSTFSHGSLNLSLNESVASKFDECAEFNTLFLHYHLLRNHWKEEPMALVCISLTRVTTHPSPVW